MRLEGVSVPQTSVLNDQLLSFEGLETRSLNLSKYVLKSSHMILYG